MSSRREIVNEIKIEVNIIVPDIIDIFCSDQTCVCNCTKTSFKNLFGVSSDAHKTILTHAHGARLSDASVCFKTQHFWYYKFGNKKIGKIGIHKHRARRFLEWENEHFHQKKVIQVFIVYVGSISYVKTLRKEDRYFPSDFAPCNHANKGNDRLVCRYILVMVKVLLRALLQIGYE